MRKTLNVLTILIVAMVIGSITMAGLYYDEELTVDGLPGDDGFNGTHGLHGADGKNGSDGLQGPPGTDGRNGTDGATGVAGAPGATGAAGATGATGAMGANGANASFYYQIYTYETSTWGPGLTANTWVTRALNTVRGGNMNGVYTSLASNTVTVQPGTYRFGILASVFAADRSVLRLWDSTNSALLCMGHSTWNNVGIFMSCIFTASSAIGVQVQHGAQTTINAGQGIEPIGSNLVTVPWVYLTVEIIKFA